MTVLTSSQAKGLAKSAQRQLTDEKTKSLRQTVKGLLDVGKKKRSLFSQVLASGFNILDPNVPKVSIYRPPVAQLKGGITIVYPNYEKTKQGHSTIHFNVILLDKKSRPINVNPQTGVTNTYSAGFLSSHAQESLFQRLHTTDGKEVMDEISSPFFLSMYYYLPTIGGIMSKELPELGKLSYGITTPNGVLLGQFIPESSEFVATTWIHKDGLNDINAKNTYIKRAYELVGVSLVDKSDVAFIPKMFAIPEDLRVLKHKQLVYTCAFTSVEFPKKEQIAFRKEGLYFANLLIVGIDIKEYKKAVAKETSWEYMDDSVLFYSCFVYHYPNFE